MKQFKDKLAIMGWLNYYIYNVHPINCPAITFDTAETILKMRRLAIKHNRACVDYCNGDIDLCQMDKIDDAIRSKFDKLAANLFQNGSEVKYQRDPRGNTIKLSYYVGKDAAGWSEYRDITEVMWL